MTEPQYLKRTTRTADTFDIDDIVSSLKKKGKRKKAVSSDDIGKILNPKNIEQKQVQYQNLQSLLKNLILYRTLKCL